MQQRNLGQYDYTYKIILVGDSYVGKTSLLHRLSNVYEPNTIATLNRDLYNSIVKLENDTLVKLMIWDTAGQERFFKSIPPQFYRDCQGAIIVYDVSCIQSFVNSSKWLDVIKETCGKNCSCILVGNKSDCEIRQVSYQNGSDLSSSLKLNFLETSAKNNVNINKCFEVMAESIVKNETRLRHEDSFSSQIMMNSFSSAGSNRSGNTANTLLLSGGKGDFDDKLLKRKKSGCCRS